MPIYNQAYYLSTMQQFAQHWKLANVELAPDSIKLEGGYTLANFNADLAALAGEFTTVATQSSSLKGTRYDAQKERTAIMRRIEQFRKVVGSAMPASRYALMLPKTPRITAVESHFVQAVEAVRTLWTLITTDPPPGFVGPLKLQGGYTIGDYESEVYALTDTFAAFNQQTTDTRNAAKTRFALLRPARQRMKQYRAAVQGRFLPNSGIYQSLPRLWPVAKAVPKPPAEQQISEEEASASLLIAA